MRVSHLARLYYAISNHICICGSRTYSSAAIITTIIIVWNSNQRTNVWTASRWWGTDSTFLYRFQTPPGILISTATWTGVNFDGSYENYSWSYDCARALASGAHNFTPLMKLWLGKSAQSLVIAHILYHPSLPLFSGLLTFHTSNRPRGHVVNIFSTNHSQSRGSNLPRRTSKIKNLRLMHAFFFSRKYVYFSQVEHNKIFS